MILLELFMIVLYAILSSSLENVTMPWFDQTGLGTVNTRVTFYIFWFHCIVLDACVESISVECVRERKQLEI